MAQEIVRIDGIKWWVQTSGGIRTPTPLCPDHDLRIQPVPPRVYRGGTYSDGYKGDALKLKCAEGPHEIVLPRKFDEEKLYIINRIDAKVFRNMKIVDLDGELTPIAKEKIKSDDGKYFITSQLMQSKRGLQLVVYAGEKGSTEKTQIFIEPKIKKVAFDQKDLNPNEVFTELKATFVDGSSHELKKGKK